MKRDIDLARKLLADIENRGADCSVSVLRTGPQHDPNHNVEERIRYHLRLLIDAGLLKEVDRTASGVPCVRLTHDGHELLELSRSEARWREAKWICQQHGAGLSINAIRGILYRWAVGAARRGFPHPTYGRRRRGYLPVDAYGHFAVHEEERFHPRTAYTVEPYRVEPYRLEPHPYDARDAWVEENDARYIHVRPEYRDRYQNYGAELNGDRAIDVDGDAVLPDYLV